jgi:type IV secretory pathway protease TraF
MVFKYPEDTSRNYIKRVVGLPGETIAVRDGDVYINDRIARKPWPVQEALWRRCLFSDKADSWKPDDDRYWTASDEELVVNTQNADEAQYVSYQRELLAYEERDPRESHRFQRITTADVMLESCLVPRAMAGTVHVLFDIKFTRGAIEVLDQWNVRFPLLSESTRPQLYRAGRLVATGVPFELRPQSPVLVQVCNVDRTLIVRLDGHEVLRYEYEPMRRIAAWPGFESEAKVALGCKRGHVAFRRLGLYADVYYTQMPDRYAVRSPFGIPDNWFFVMGDNSINSNDSRQWGPVPRRYLVGDAFLVLWPLGRMKVVR